MIPLFFCILFLLIGYFLLIYWIRDIEKRRQRLSQKHQELKRELYQFKREYEQTTKWMAERIHSNACSISELFPGKRGVFSELDILRGKFECLINHLNLEHVPNAQIPPHFKKKEEQK